MEFRRQLISKGVSPEGVLEVLAGQRVTHAGDLRIIKQLGYYVAPGGEVSLAKSLGSESALPKDWLALERNHTVRTNSVAHVDAKRAFGTTQIKLDRAEQLRIATLPPAQLRGSIAVAPSKSSAAMSSLIGLAGKLDKAAADKQAAAAKKAAEEARQAKIKKLELEIASVQAQLEQVGRKLDAELAKEIGIMHLANPITFPFFLVVYGNWKQGIQKLQKKLIELVNKLIALCTELINLKNS